MTRTVFRWLLALCFLAAGFNHFRQEHFYLQMMPAYVPWHLELIYLSGLAEMAGGIGVLIRPLRRFAAWGLIVLLLAIFPANLQAALHGFQNVPPALLWIRLPLQALLIAWVYWTCLSKNDASRDRPDH